MFCDKENFACASDADECVSRPIATITLTRGEQSVSKLRMRFIFAESALALAVSVQVECPAIE